MAKNKAFYDMAAAFLAPIIRAFLKSDAAKKGNWTPTRLGREATKAPNRIFEIQAGSQPRAATALKILKLIEKTSPGLIKDFLSTKVKGQLNEQNSAID